MNLISILIMIALAVAMVFAVRSIWKHKGHCSNCDGSCSGCSACRKEKDR